jgi:hypothetical protein
VSTGGRFYVGAQVTEQCVILAVTFEQDVPEQCWAFPSDVLNPTVHEDSIVFRCPSVIHRQPTKQEQ